LTKDSSKQVSLQLLLFVDHRPSSQEYIEKLHQYINSLETNYSFQLEVIQLEDQPHLVEHFKLVVTPALVKISPGTRQTIAGTDLISQVEKWWDRWQAELINEEKLILENYTHSGPDCSSVGYSAELLKFADEVFLLKKQNQELLKQLKFKDQILAMLVHDLRSPLTAVTLALDTLQIAEKTLSPEKLLTLKDHLYQQTKHQFKIMDRMICDILQASQSVSNKFEIRPKPLFLQYIFPAILTQITQKIQSKSQILTTDIPQDIPQVYGDEKLLSQVLINLLENASKYTPEGGTINLSLLHRTSQKIQVSICDNGPGIPEEDKYLIFDDHFRLKRDRNQEGFGIGLALCRQVITSHYGQIWVENCSSGGSCFHFTLPVYKP
jgi:two-component system, OmpR family, clock-associated histidine kinase SasA